MEVSIVIPTKNEASVLEECLRSIQDMDYPSAERETIIVDGHSTDDTVEVAKKYGCRIVYENVGTIGGARNIGVENSSGIYIVFTDADCIVERSWLHNLIRFLKDHDAISVGGPNITPDNDTTLAKCVGTVLTFLSKPGARYGFNEQKPREIWHNPTCNVAYRKDVFKEVGGFNEDLVTCDDEELDYRLREKGYRIFYTPDARVLHHRRPSWKKYAKMAFNYGLGRMQAIKLHHKMGKWFHYIPPVIISLIFVLFVMSLFSQALSLITLYISLAGVIGIGIISLNLSKFRKNFFILYGLISIWFFGYGFGMLRGLLEYRALSTKI